VYSAAHVEEIHRGVLELRHGLHLGESIGKIVPAAGEPASFCMSSGRKSHPTAASMFYRLFQALFL
jgi:hypothetical protein